MRYTVSKALPILLLTVAAAVTPARVAAQTSDGCGVAARVGLQLPVTRLPFGPTISRDLGGGPGVRVDGLCGFEKGLAGGAGLEAVWFEGALIKYLLGSVGFQTTLGDSDRDIRLLVHSELGVAVSEGRGWSTAIAPASGFGVERNDTGFAWGVGGRVTWPIRDDLKLLAGTSVRTTYLDRIRFPGGDPAGVKGLVTIPLSLGVLLEL